MFLINKRQGRSIQFFPLAFFKAGGGFSERRWDDSISLQEVVRSSGLFSRLLPCDNLARWKDRWCNLHHNNQRYTHTHTHTHGQAISLILSPCICNISCIYRLEFMNIYLWINFGNWVRCNITCPSFVHWPCTRWNPANICIFNFGLYWLQCHKISTNFDNLGAKNSVGNLREVRRT